VSDAATRDPTAKGKVSLVRNVWKGLAVGGLTGVAAGVVLDMARKASDKASAVGGRLKERAPEAGHWVHEVTEKASDWLQEADVPEHLRSAAHKIKDSDASRRVTDAANDAISTAREATVSRSG